MSSHTKNAAPDHRLCNDAENVVYAHDLGGNFTYLNQAGERISGYSREEACRMNIAELVAPEIAARIREQVLSDVTKKIGTVYEIEIVAKDGLRVPLEVSTRVVVSEGQAIAIEGIAVPSMLRRESSSKRSRCLDADFIFVS